MVPGGEVNRNRIGGNSNSLSLFPVVFEYWRYELLISEVVCCGSCRQLCVNAVNRGVENIAPEVLVCRAKRLWFLPCKVCGSGSNNTILLFSCENVRNLLRCRHYGKAHNS